MPQGRPPKLHEQTLRTASTINLTSRHLNLTIFPPSLRGGKADKAIQFLHSFKY
jgi:hypothetical protein